MHYFVTSKREHVAEVVDMIRHTFANGKPTYVSTDAHGTTVYLVDTGEAIGRVRIFRPNVSPFNTSYNPSDNITMREVRKAWQQKTGRM